MAFTVNIRHLEDKNLHLQGEISPEELDIDPKDEVIHLVHPASYDLEVQLLEESLLVTGKIMLPLACDCVRCLRSFEHVIKLDPWSVHIPLKGEDAAPVNNDLVDLTPYLREDILLDFPQHPLCSSECGGLRNPDQDTSGPGKNPAGKKQADDSAWRELNKLKL